MNTLKDIQISKIRITENHRTNIESTSLEELMQSIKQHGLMQPIGVAIDGNNGYILRFGQRRLLAYKKLGYKTIQAMVSGTIKQGNLLIENLTENMQRKDPSFAELGRVIEKLEKNEMTLKQISVRLGLPYQKIMQIVSVYKSLPEKYRKKVYFMEKGGGRKERKGAVPANVAVKIASMKKEHSLKDKDIDVVFKAVADQGMDKLDLVNVGNLVSAGLSAEQALQRVREYGVFAVEVVCNYSDLTALVKSYGLTNKQHLFKKVIYGELPALVKPDFVSTGPKIAIKKLGGKIIVDTKPFENMFEKLVLMENSGGFDENQSLAIKQIKKVRPANWSEGQRRQIEMLYYEKIIKKS